MPRRAAIAAALLCGGVSVAASAPSLHAGLWRVASAPEAATLDGRRLDDLPYTPPPAETICMSAAQAADPAAWIARDSPAGCVFSHRSVRGGTVDIAGTCPSASQGYPAGTVRFTGTWSQNRYRVRFATADSGDNGRMGFTGTATGERVGDCP